MAKIIIMVGLSGSGKSSYAKTIKDAVIVSSDDIREELSYRADQSQNGKVFRTFHSRVDSLLKEGKTVVADATNLTMKSRRPLIDIAKRNHAYVSVCLVIKPFEKCVSDDLNREHSVGRDVIKKQINRFQMPFYEEGIDTIEIYRDKSCGLIGTFNRWYETMVFESLYDEYDDANVEHEIDIWTECGIYGETWHDACNNYDNDLDIEANMMHDKVVKEMCVRISKLKDMKDNGELFREEND